MDVPQLYTALQQGVIDGIEATPPFFWTLRYYELAQYLFTEPDGCVVTLFMINKKWLDSLPADLRAAVLKSAEEIQPMAEKFTRGGKVKSYEVMQKNGVKVIHASPQLKAQMKEAAEMGAYIEFIYYSVGRPGAKVTMKDYADAIKTIGPERCILSSCGGQAWLPVHTFAWSELFAGMRDNGIAERAIGLMTRTNPARLLGLD